MKALLTIVIFSVITASSFTQNYDFEEWVDGNPVGWFTGNIPTMTPVEQVTDAQNGSYAVKGTVIMTPVGRFGPILAAGPDVMGFPINFRPAALRGWYKFLSDSGDAFFISVVAIKEHHAIGSGGFYTTDVEQSYKLFTANIVYNSQEIPDTMQITVITSGSPSHVGTTFFLDNLSYGTTTDVEDANKIFIYKLEQNYPNPFNPSTTIEYSIAELNNVKIVVYDALGREAAVLVDKEQKSGSYRINFDGSNLASGIYFYKMISGKFVQTKQLLLIK